MEFTLEDIPIAPRAVTHLLERGYSLEDLLKEGSYESVVSIKGVGKMTAIKAIVWAAVFLEARRSVLVIGNIRDRLDIALPDSVAKVTNIKAAISDAIAYVEDNNQGTISESTLLAEIRQAAARADVLPLPQETTGFHELVLPEHPSRPYYERMNTAVYRDEPQADSPRAAQAKNTPHG
jgi:hypothetical protein